MQIQACKCGATMLWHWGYESWFFDCIVCGATKEVKLPAVEEKKWR